MKAMEVLCTIHAVCCMLSIHMHVHRPKVPLNSETKEVVDRASIRVDTIRHVRFEILHSDDPLLLAMTAPCLALP
jgi:hypothetical protein